MPLADRPVTVGDTDNNSVAGKEEVHPGVQEGRVEVLASGASRVPTSRADSCQLAAGWPGSLGF